MSRELDQKVEESTPRPVTWSFTPIGSGLIALTDILATSGDLFGPASYLLIAVPFAILGGAGVFVTELMESRRVMVSILKAAIAAFLIVIPLPVGGIVGAGASLGHRALRKSEEGGSSQGR